MNTLENTSESERLTFEQISPLKEVSSSNPKTPAWRFLKNIFKENKGHFKDVLQDKKSSATPMLKKKTRRASCDNSLLNLSKGSVSPRDKKEIKKSFL